MSFHNKKKVLFIIPERKKGIMYSIKYLPMCLSVFKNLMVHLLPG